MKTLAALKSACEQLGIDVATNGRPSKTPYITALRQFHWEREHPGEPLPSQIEPMLLADWRDLDTEEAAALEDDHHSWIVQEKKDGVRALLHIDQGRVRITSRCISEVNYRLSENQANVPHLAEGLSQIEGTILDGELVCPEANVDTGSTTTTSQLQAAVAVLATTPANAVQIQRDDRVKLRFHAFDVLKARHNDLTKLPLRDRLSELERSMNAIDNRFIEVVPSFAVNKAAIHQTLVDGGSEGTVWKNVNEPYQAGRRVKHWIKRKREVSVEAFVTGFKLGTPSNGHSHLIGAVEFSINNGAGSPTPIAWVSSWSDEERSQMTWKNRDGEPTLNPTYYGRMAVIVGQDKSQRSGRIRHARLQCWDDTLPTQ